MEYMTVKQAAQQWGISDRRVRILCADKKVTGAVKDGKSYKIPMKAGKPADGRYRDGKVASDYSKRLLKWNDDVIGVIASDCGVTSNSPEYNEIVKLYTCGRSSWTPEQFAEFLSERSSILIKRD